jgi:CRISPR-associated endonuclease/helicase Cas3
MANRSHPSPEPYVPAAAAPQVGPWAKLRRACHDGQGDGCRRACACPVRSSLSLIGHSADVAAVMQALLERPIIAQRFAKLIGKPELTAEDRARLVALAALHDLGKINLGFQNKPFDHPGPKAGHIEPLVSLITNITADNAAEATKEALFEGGKLRRLIHLIDQDSNRWPFDAIMAHHGSLPGALPPRANLWRAAGGYDPIRSCSDLVEAISSWFPSALEPTKIAWTSPFGHAFAGLLTLADWLGSDDTVFLLPQDGGPEGPDRFPWALALARNLLCRRGLAPDPARTTASGLTWTCMALTGFAQASLAQAAMLSLRDAPDNGRTCLIEDETGSGKTEAALIHFLRLFAAGEVDGMYFALPTRAAARQIHGRIKSALKRLLGDDAARYVTLGVPGYVARQAEGASLPEPEAHWPDESADARRDALWASERPKRYLAGWVAVGTIDQVLMGGVRVRHAQLRSGAMLRLILVVDEVHSSDLYMTTILRNVLDQHRRAGGHALLMSATLGSAARAKLLSLTGRTSPPAFAAALATPYPAVWTDTEPQPLDQPGNKSRDQKTVAIAVESFWDDPVRIIARAADAARQHAQVLVIRNTVRDVVATQLALEMAAPEFSLGIMTDQADMVRCPHHARYAPEDRARLDGALESVLGKDAPRLSGSVTVTSQTAEQSLDIDADLLITDLCPSDVLLQRIGRLHRHRARLRPDGFELPSIIILAPSEEELAASIRSGGEVNNPPLALGLVYPDLLGILATRRALTGRGSLSIPRDNRLLVETATHPEVLRGLATSLGGRWLERWASQEGTKGAHAGAARGVCVKWKEPIEPVLDLDERIATRLGINDRVIELPAGTIGPFGETVSLLTVPGRWLGGVKPDAVPMVTSAGPGTSLAIQLGERMLVYDRFGLRPRP